MTVLVTGAAGFIGYHLCRRLLERGDRVAGLDNLNGYYEVSLKEARLAELDKLGGDFTFYKVGLEDATTLQRIFADEGFEKVVNLAAQGGVRYSIEAPQAYIDSNITGFLNILNGCRDTGVEHLIYASSSSVYGDNDISPFSTEARVDRPLSIYAATKLADELMAHVYHHQFEMNLTGLRFFTVYGPWGRPDMSAFLFLGALLNDRPIKLFNEGSHRRDFTYVDDIVEGIIRIVDAKSVSGSGVYNIGLGEPVDLLEYVEILERLTGKQAIKELLPMQPGDVEATWADVSALERDFGYRPSVSIESGLEQFVRWYRDYYQI